MQTKSGRKHVVNISQLWIIVWKYRHGSPNQSKKMSTFQRKWLSYDEPRYFSDLKYYFTKHIGQLCEIKWVKDITKMKLLKKIIILFIITCNSYAEDKHPTILVSILVRNKAHTLPYFLSNFESLNYPKDRMSLW